MTNLIERYRAAFRTAYRRDVEVIQEGRLYFIRDAARGTNTPMHERDLIESTARLETNFGGGAGLPQQPGEK